MEYLETELSSLLDAARAKNTTKTYEVGVQCLKNFRTSHGLPRTYPVPLPDLAMFIAFLSSQGYSPATAATYVAAIGYVHKLNGWPDPTEKFIIRRILDGFSRKKGREPDVRRPITLDMLKRIAAALPHVCTSSYEARLFHAMFTMAFFGFMRVSEITANSSSAVQDALEIGDTQFQDLNNALTLCITLRRSKTNQNGPPQLITIPAQVCSSICPVKANQSYLNIRPSGASPMFCHYDKSPVTRAQFNAVLHKALDFAGVQGKFGSHSFRIGAATTAAMQGVPDEKIQELGRWRSKAYKSYIRMPAAGSD